MLKRIEDLLTRLADRILPIAEEPEGRDRVPGSGTASSIAAEQRLPERDQSFYWTWAAHGHW